MAETSTLPYGLIVDDDVIILTDAAQMLELAGLRTLTAMNAREAVALLERFEGAVSVLFTDVEMPGDMDGFALARETARRWPHMAIMVASGRSNPADGDLPASARFIRKPFSAELVHGHLQELLPEGRKPEPLRQAR